jgi:hypothetical protein
VGLQLLKTGQRFSADWNSRAAVRNEADGKEHGRQHDRQEERWGSGPSG